MQKKAEKEADTRDAKEEWEGREGKAAETGRWRLTGERAKGRTQTEGDGVEIAMFVSVVRLFCLVLTALETNGELRIKIKIGSRIPPAKICPAEW